MCEQSCYQAIPEGAAWAVQLESSQIGSIVANRDGYIVVHGVDPVLRAVAGLHDAVCPEGLTVST